MDRYNIYIRIERKTTETNVLRRRKLFAVLVLGILAAAVGALAWWSLLRPEGPQSPAMDSSVIGLPTHSMELESRSVADLTARGAIYQSVFGRDLDQGSVQLLERRTSRGNTARVRSARLILPASSPLV